MKQGSDIHVHLRMEYNNFIIIIIIIISCDQQRYRLLCRVVGWSTKIPHSSVATVFALGV